MRMRELLVVRVRPQNINEIYGQEHLLGENKILRNIVENGQIFSMILYGEPGIGKTTIAEAIVKQLGLKYRMLNAVINTKKDFDIVVEEAKMYSGLIVIMDEIHRLNKDKQDLLLPYLENGLITLIGLTTSNPYHTINPAIRSRCQIFELHELTEEDIVNGLNNIAASANIKADDETFRFIAHTSSGDFRSAINLLDIAASSTLNNVINLN